MQGSSKQVGRFELISINDEDGYSRGSLFTGNNPVSTTKSNDSEDLHNPFTYPKIPTPGIKRTLSENPFLRASAFSPRPICSPNSVLQIGKSRHAFGHASDARPGSPSMIETSRVKSINPRGFDDSLEELENRLMEALKLQREEELAVIQFNLWQANALKQQLIRNESGIESGSISTGVPRSHVCQTNNVATTTTLPNSHSFNDSDDGSLLHFEDLTICNKIGEGAFGEVYRSLLWGQEVAVKKPRTVGRSSSEPLKATPVSNKLMSDYMREVQILRNLRHPNILNFMGIAFRPPDEFCIVTEYLSNGSLAKLLQNRRDSSSGPLQLRKVIRYAKDIARALNYLHHKGVIHRDIKPSNLLLDKSDSVKISDFGLSHFRKPDQLNNTVVGIIGTPIYMAPEVSQSLAYGTRADVFSFAIVVAEILIGDYPYGHLDQPFTSKSFANAVVSGVRPLLPTSTPEPFRRLIEACWKLDPEARPDFTHILNWLGNIEESLLSQRSLNQETLDIQHVDKRIRQVSEPINPAQLPFGLTIPPVFPLSSDLTICSADIFRCRSDQTDLDELRRMVEDDKARVKALLFALEGTNNLLINERQELNDLKRQTVEMQIETAKLENNLTSVTQELLCKDEKILELENEIKLLRSSQNESDKVDTVPSKPAQSATRPKRLFFASKTPVVHHHHYDHPGVILPSLVLSKIISDGNINSVDPNSFANLTTNVIPPIFYTPRPESLPCISEHDSPMQLASSASNRASISTPLMNKSLNESFETVKSSFGDSPSVGGTSFRTNSPYITGIDPTSKRVVARRVSVEVNRTLDIPPTATEAKEKETVGTTSYLIPGLSFAAAVGKLKPPTIETTDSPLSNPPASKQEHAGDKHSVPISAPLSAPHLVRVTSSPANLQGRLSKKRFVYHHHHFHHVGYDLHTSNSNFVSPRALAITHVPHHNSAFSLPTLLQEVSKNSPLVHSSVLHPVSTYSNEFPLLDNLKNEKQ